MKKRDVGADRTEIRLRGQQKINNALYSRLVIEVFTTNDFSLRPVRIPDRPCEPVPELGLVLVQGRVDNVVTVKNGGEFRR